MAFQTFDFEHTIPYDVIPETSRLHYILYLCYITCDKDIGQLYNMKKLVNVEHLLLTCCLFTFHFISVFNRT